jgi:hypothetical protein
MKALTISQPYASLIATGAKWVENRTQDFRYRGWLLIHAGKGEQYMTRAAMREQNLPYGQAIAVCRLAASVHVPDLRRRIAARSPYPGMTVEDLLDIVNHAHTEGPWGLVLREVRVLPVPIPCSGALGLWNPGPAIEREVRRQLGISDSQTL